MSKRPRFGTLFPSPTLRPFDRLRDHRLSERLGVSGQCCERKVNQRVLPAITCAKIPIQSGKRYGQAKKTGFT